MSDRDAVLVISHLTDSQDVLEQIVKVNGLIWGQPSDVAEKVTQLRAQLTESIPVQRCLMVANLGCEVVGFAQAARIAGPSRQWMFSRLMTHPNYQRCGVATKLCEACVAHAKANGASALRSETHLDNGASISFHAAFGFVNEGEFTRPDGDRKMRFSYPLT
jgi:ribosomal protein S18 acetylase RimI-like enzyme